MPGKTWARIRLAHRAQFWLERQFVKGASYQLLAVAALIGLISLLGGLLVLPVEPPAATLGETVWWAFLRLSDPGYLGDDVGAWRRIVSTILTVAGYVVFLGALVAIMTQWLNVRMRRLESGLTPVATRNHIAVLGWSNRTLPVLGEILQSAGRVKRFLAHLRTSRLQIVVLSDEVTPWHVQTLRDHPAIRRRERDIVLRSGTPLVVDDLDRVDCLNAAVVIIPGAASSNVATDMAIVKALLSLSSHPDSTPERLPYVVAEIQDPRNVTVARRAYRGPLEVISGSSIISRLTAQILRNRGLSRVYAELLSHQVGCGIYVREAGALHGLGIAAAASRFPGAVVCGLVRPRQGDFEPWLNPPPDMTLEAEDRLVFVAPDYESTTPAAGPGKPPRPLAAGPVTGRDQHAATSRRLLVLGWNDNVVTLLHELAQYEGEAFDVTIVSLVVVEQREAAMQRAGSLGRVVCRQVLADYAAEASLRALEPQDFDNVLLASSQRLASGEEADTRALVGYLLLEELLDGHPRPPQVLLEIQDPDNEQLIGGRAAEVLVAPKVLAHMVAQVALRRELRVVYDELFTSGGPEIVYRPPERYGISDRSAEFAAMQQTVAAAGETLLGVYHPGRDVLALSPGRSTTLALAADDLLVVITTAS